MKKNANEESCKISKVLAGLVSITLVLPATQALAFGIGLGKVGKPVHETITHDAVKTSGILKSPLYGPTIEELKAARKAETADSKNDGESEKLVKEGKKKNGPKKMVVKHFLEGVRFNDDPKGYFMPGSDEHAESFDLLRFLSNFLGNTSKPDVHDPTKSSHFGSYQFLHAMGMANEPRANVKAKIMKYMKHCWKLATEPDSLKKFTSEYEDLVPLLKQMKDSEATRVTPISDSEIDALKMTPWQRIFWDAAYRFDKDVLFFYAYDRAKSEFKYASEDLDSKALQLKFQSRALGSMLHIIQDSHAKGHAVREGWENEGNDTNTGAVRYFQDYSAQDSGEHGDFDTPQGDNVLASQEKSDSIQDYAHIPGSKVAFEQSRDLLKMAAAGCLWDQKASGCLSSVEDYLDQVVFPVANNRSDEPSVSHTHPSLMKKERIESDVKHAPYR